MSGTSTRSVMVSFRMPVDDFRRIQELLKKPRSPSTSVSGYCKEAMHWYVNRGHERVRKLRHQE